MRKLRFYLLFSLLLISGVHQVSAQCTVNPPSNNPGIYPASLPNGCVGQPYAQEVQFVFPLDTTIAAPPFGTFVVPFDSFEIVTLLNVPAGLNYTLNSPTSKYYPVSATVSARGCGDLAGTPTTQTPASNNVRVVVRAWATAPIVGVQVAVDTFSQPLAVYNSPSASFTSTGGGGNTVNFSGSGGSGVTRAWDFGDGNTASTQNPTHTYAAQGNYNVCYILTNNGGCADTSCQVISVGCGAPAAQWSSTQSGLSVNFTDNTVTGSASGWLWDFGDGNISTSQNPTHTYTAAGTYLVCMVITDTCGTDSTCGSITVCESVTGGFAQGINGLTLTLTDLSTGPVTAWAWNFGDGSSSAMQNPSHTYTSSGTYTVTQTVYNSCGDSASISLPVQICDPPAASFTFSVAGDGVTYTFTDGTTGQPAQWSWDFGDGNFDNVQNPTHTFSGDTTVTVCMVVTDSCAVQDTFCQSLTVVAMDGPDMFREVTVYPNPAQQQLHIQASFGVSADVTIRVHDLVGKVMHQENAGMVRNLNKEISVESLPGGVYFLTVEANGLGKTIRFIKE